MSTIDESDDVSAQLRQLEQLTREIDNFRDIAKYILPTPGEVPRLQGFDVFGGTLPLSGSVGGDHLIYVDFKQRFDLDARIALAREQGRPDVVTHLEWCRRKAGIALVDVSGHRMTDALLAAMLHQAFLLGAIYELDVHGRITRRLFEHLNTRFYQSSGAHKFVSLIYGEMAEDATFRFLSAAMPFPSVFSARHDRFMEVSPDLRISFPAARHDAVVRRHRPQHHEQHAGVQGPLRHEQVAADGRRRHPAAAHRRPERARARRRGVLSGHGSRRRCATPSAGRPATSYEAVTADLLAFSPPADDISLVVIKRT